MERVVGLVKSSTTAGNLFSFEIDWPTGPGKQFQIDLNNTDADHLQVAKESMIQLVVSVDGTTQPVSVFFDQDAGPDATTPSMIQAEQPTLLPIGAAISGEPFALSGANIAPDTVVFFENTERRLRLDPTIVRPHWVFLEDLDITFTPGAQESFSVYLDSPSVGRSKEIEVTVKSPPPDTNVRILNRGGGMAVPFTIVFVATPAVELDGGEIVRDPIMDRRATYHEYVSLCLQQLFHHRFAEDVARLNNIDRAIRIISIFDDSLDTQPLTSENAFVRLLPGSTPRETVAVCKRAEILDLQNRYPSYFQSADLMFALTDHPDAALARATYMDDDITESTSYTFDVEPFFHGHHTGNAGLAAIPGHTLTPFAPLFLHEFCHAISARTSSNPVVDLYNDDRPQGNFRDPINKKWRASSDDPVPPVFAEYNGVEYLSDLNKDYDDDWESYHPELIDSDHPNVMDVFDGPNSRLDRLTFQYLSDRIRLKIFR